MAKYPYIVKYKGKWYSAGEDVPESKAIEETLLPYSDINKPYTKTDINKMSKTELQQLAKNIGIADADEITGAELKEKLINIYEL